MEYGMTKTEFTAVTGAILRTSALLAWLAAATLAPVLCPTLSRASAETGYPARPVQIVVPFVPGGNTDLITRIIADGLALALKQPFTVVTKPAPPPISGRPMWRRASRTATPC
jgi:hypothetical protein